MILNENKIFFSFLTLLKHFFRKHFLIFLFPIKVDMKKTLGLLNHLGSFASSFFAVPLPFLYRIFTNLWVKFSLCLDVIVSAVCGN